MGFFSIFIKEEYHGRDVFIGRDLLYNDFYRKKINKNVLFSVETIQF
jgi:hypothetical protein